MDAREGFSASRATGIELVSHCTQNNILGCSEQRFGQIWNDFFSFGDLHGFRSTWMGRCVGSVGDFCNTDVVDLACELGLESLLSVMI